MAEVPPLAAPVAPAGATQDAEAPAVAAEPLEAFAALLASRLEPSADAPAAAPRPETLEDPVAAPQAPLPDSLLLALPALPPVEAGRAPAAATGPQSDAAAPARPAAGGRAPLEAELPAADPTAPRRAPTRDAGDVLASTELPQAQIAASEAERTAPGAAPPEPRASHAAAAAGEGLPMPHHLLQAPAPGPAPAAPTFTVREPVGAPRWSEAVGDRLVLMARDHVQAAELHVHPPELGPVTVRIDVTGNEATVVFGVASAETRNALEAALPRLAESLAANGIALAQAEVGSDLGPRHGRDADGAPARPRGGLDGADAAPPPPARTLARPGLVDTFA